MCGFQVSLFSGRRSRNLRVSAACSSNSASMCRAIDWLVIDSATVIGFSSLGECGFPYFSGLGSSLSRVDLSPSPLCARTNVLMDEIPSGGNVLPMRFLHQPERCMAELDHRFAAFFAQAILHVVGHGIRHEQRSAELQQRGLVDGLHRGPEVAVAVTKVAEPATARPRLQLHGQGRAIGTLVGRPNLLEQRREGYID